MAHVWWAAMAPQPDVAERPGTGGRQPRARPAPAHLLAEALRLAAKLHLARGLAGLADLDPLQAGAGGGSMRGRHERGRGCAGAGGRAGPRPSPPSPPPRSGT